MSFYERVQKHIALDWFEKNAYPHEAEYARAAFDGDVEAAFSLSCALENHKRGVVAVAMWRCKVPREAFRAYFSSVWDHDHRWVIDAAKTRRCLAYMFRYAEFPIPDELPDVVRVWRGSSKLNMSEARQGYAWTTDRDTACWFAMRFADVYGSPLVLAADVAKTDIALFHDERNEREVVLMKPPANILIDGNMEDWAHGYGRFEAGKNLHMVAD